MIASALRSSDRSNHCMSNSKNSMTCTSSSRHRRATLKASINCCCWESVSGVLLKEFSASSAGVCKRWSLPACSPLNPQIVESSVLGRLPVQKYEYQGFEYRVYLRLTIFRLKVGNSRDVKVLATHSRVALSPQSISQSFG